MFHTHLTSVRLRVSATLRQGETASTLGSYPRDSRCDSGLPPRVCRLMDRTESFYLSNAGSTPARRTIDIGENMAVVEDIIVKIKIRIECPNCNEAMYPEHAHFRCAACGYRSTCCEGEPLCA